MSTAAETVESLKEMVSDAQDDLKMMVFMQTVVRESEQLARKMGLCDRSRAYALAGCACAIAEVVGDREPVILALIKSWPEMCREVTEEELDEMERR